MCDCFPDCAEEKELKQEDVLTPASSSWLLLSSPKDCLCNIPGKLDIQLIMQQGFLFGFVSFCVFFVCFVFLLKRMEKKKKSYRRACLGRAIRKKQRSSMAEVWVLSAWGAEVVQST